MLRSVQLGCGQLIVLGHCVVDKPVVSVVQFLEWFVGSTISQTRQLVLAYVPAKRRLRNCHAFLEQTCPYLR